MSHHGKSAERKWVYNPQYNSAMLLWIAWKHEKDPTKMSQLTRKYEWSSDFVDFSVCLMIWRKVGSMLIVFSLFSYVKISTSIPTSNLDHNSHQNSTIPSAFFWNDVNISWPTEILIFRRILFCQKFSHLWPHWKFRKFPISTHLWQKGYSIRGEHLGSSSRGAPPSLQGFHQMSWWSSVDGWNPIPNHRLDVSNLSKFWDKLPDTSTD